MIFAGGKRRLFFKCVCAKATRFKLPRESRRKLFYPASLMLPFFPYIFFLSFLERKKEEKRKKGRRQRKKPNWIETIPKHILRGSKFQALNQKRPIA
jgi:hypothetical protein